jgi:Coenzyme PQQ synthesis protein D (PqqD)
MNKIKSLVINESGFTFDPFTGETFTMNETGAMIIRHLREDVPLDKISEELVKAFNVNAGDAYTDILEFRNKLVIYGLLEVSS